jgi:hypothetical protein
MEARSKYLILVASIRSAMGQRNGNKGRIAVTTKGKAVFILRDIETYQQALDVAACTNAEEGVRQGLEDAGKGRTRPAREFFEDVERQELEDTRRRVRTSI